MVKSKFIQQFLKQSKLFQDCDGAHQFSINDIDYCLDTTSSGRVLLWRDYATLIAWTEDWDYQALAEIAYNEQNILEAAECNPADFPGMTPEELKLYEVAE